MGANRAGYTPDPTEVQPGGAEYSDSN